MLKFIFALCFASALIYEGHAQDTLKIVAQPSIEPDQPLQRIKVSDLPDAIGEKISGEEYSGWMLKAAYRTVPPKSDGTEADSVDYVVELKKEEETIRVRFDGNGELSED